MLNLLDSYCNDIINGLAGRKAIGVSYFLNLKDRSIAAPSLPGSTSESGAKNTSSKGYWVAGINILGTGTVCITGNCNSFN